MDTEIAALAASGATTLISLMVTDSWTQARNLVARFLSHADTSDTAIADMDTARAALLFADSSDPQTTQEIIDRWHAHLYRLLQAAPVTSDDLRDLLTSLQGVANGSAGNPVVRNDITGGVQNGPVIQSGRITGLTFHLPGRPLQE
jgi:hypothetical protein